MRRALARACVLLFLVLGLGAAPALGADGRAEINMAAVAAAGGFPYAISQPGSYVLNGDLRVPDENTTAIEITADDVTLDLNGFSISGVVECTSTATDTTCSSFGSGFGIEILSANVAVRNGTVRGTGRHGIGGETLGLRIERVRAVSNSGCGLRLGQDALISDSEASRNGACGLGTSFENNDTPANLFTGSTAADNGATGIRSASFTVFVGNTAANNHLRGIKVSSASVVRDNTSSSSVDVGVRAEFGSVISGNALRQNGQAGISCQDGSTVRDNTVETSGRAGTDAGFSVGLGSTVLGNASRLNTGIGFVMGTTSGYGDNVASDNTVASYSAPALAVGCNIGDASTICPSTCP